MIFGIGGLDFMLFVIGVYINYIKYICVCGGYFVVIMKKLGYLVWGLFCYIFDIEVGFLICL